MDFEFPKQSKIGHMVDRSAWRKCSNSYTLFKGKIPTDLIDTYILEAISEVGIGELIRQCVDIILILKPLQRQTLILS